MKILYLVFSYLLGSIPSGYLIFRFSEKKDIRRFGSQSTGATNVFRLKGLKMALPVILIDVLKGFLPAYLALEIFADRRIAIAAAFLAVLGHCFPVYIKFKGGKGVATSMGAYAALAFKPFLISLLLFILIIIISRYVSLGSLLGSLFFPFSVWLLKGENILSFGSLAIFAVIFLRHWSNIGRLLQGKERKFGQKAEV